MRVLHLGLLRLLPVHSAPSAMSRAGRWWREPLIIEDELDRDHHVLRHSQAADRQKIASSTREPQRAKRARRPPAPLPHLAVHRTGSAGRAAPQNRAESAACTSSGHLMVCSVLMTSIMWPWSPAWRRVSSRAATNCAFVAIYSVLGFLISMPSPPAVRSQPLLANLAAAGRAPTARRWASHVAPLSAARLVLLSYLLRRVRCFEQLLLNR